jgi:hypothetical protein
MIRSNSGIRSARWTPPAGGEASPRAVVSNTMLLHMTMRKMRSIRSNDEIGFPFRRTTITFGMRLMRWHDDTVLDEPKRTPRQKLRVRKSAGPALIFPDSVDSALKPAWIGGGEKAAAGLRSATAFYALLPREWVA